MTEASRCSIFHYCSLVAFLVAVPCSGNDRSYDSNAANMIPNRKYHNHSSVTCKTRSYFSGNIDRTVPSNFCHLKDLCWDPYILKFVYYLDDKLNSLWGHDASNQAIFNLKTSFLKITRDRGPKVFTGELPIIEKRGPIPRSVVYASPRVHVFYDSFWAANFGHAVFDDVLPVYSLMHHFYMVTRDVQVLTLEDIARNLKRKKDKTLYPRGRRILEKYFSYISDLAPIEMMAPQHEQVFNLAQYKNFHKLNPQLFDNGEAPAESNILCFSNLLIGHSHLGLGYDQGRVVHSFMDAIFTQIKLKSALVTVAMETPISEQLVLVLVKNGRRRIINTDEVIASIREQFHGVKVLPVDVATMRTEEQVQLAQRATVIISPEGGISFFCAFARLHASAIIPGHYDAKLNTIVHMEKFFWDVFDQIDVIYYFPDVDTELVYEPLIEAKRKYPGGQGSLTPEAVVNRSFGIAGVPVGRMRDYMSIYLNMTRLMPFVETAIYRSAHTFNILPNY